jgi:SAM-dependent methyltransferase
MDDPYLDGTCRWWHLGRPSPELLAAEADGWLGPAGVAVDLGCGLGTEIAHLAAAGWTAVGIDLSASALRSATFDTAVAARVTLAEADVLQLPVRAASADLLLDRGCFHYLPPASRAAYADEARRVLRPGGRFLLRACQTAAGVVNDLDVSVLIRVFAAWHIQSVTVQDIVSDTRAMPALVARLTRP